MSRSGLAYVAAGVAIGVVFVLIGYFAYASMAGVDGSISFERWIARPIRRGIVWWFTTGVAVGVALRFAFCRGR